MFRFPFGKNKTQSKSKVAVSNVKPRSALRRWSVLADRRFEPLEDRTTPAILTTQLPNVDVNRSPGSDAETTIAVNPLNPQNLLASVIDEASIFTDHQNIWRSTNGGQTWQVVQVDLPQGFAFSNGDPAIVFDANGRALLTHMGSPQNNPGGLGMISAVSDDEGLTWTPGIITDGATPGDDKIFCGVGPDKLDPTQQRFYATFQRASVIVASSSTDGINWSAPVPVSDDSGNIGSYIAVDNNGDVYCTWEHWGDPGISRIVVAVSRDAGQTWSPDQTIATSNVNAFQDPASGGGSYLIPAQPFRGILASLSIQVDRSNGPFSGRLYVSYTDQGDRDGNVFTDHDNTDIFVLASADGGLSWNALGADPIRVNDDPGSNSQFFPYLSVDQVTGNVGVGWYDCRMDTGNLTDGDTNGIPNDEAQYWAAVSDNGGQSFSPNVALSGGTSNSHSFPTGFDFGDYTGTAFFNGVFYGAWADNSDSTGNNPDGANRGLDLYVGTALVGAAIAVDSISINPVFAVNPTGTFHTVTATALDINAQPIANAPVVFEIVGANGPLTATAFTDANGIAQIQYVGNAAGFDQITAFSGLATDVAQKQWILQSQMAGIVYVDNNNNGVIDPGELGIPSVTLTLTGNDSNGNPVSIQTTTDASGAYTFVALFASDANGYAITETQPAAYIDGIVSTLVGVPGVNVIFNIVLGEGQQLNGFLFGERGLSPEYITKRFFFSDSGTNVVPGNVTSPTETKTLAAFAPANPALPAAIAQAGNLAFVVGAEQNNAIVNLVQFAPKPFVPATGQNYIKSLTTPTQNLTTNNTEKARYVSIVDSVDSTNDDKPIGYVSIMTATLKNDVEFE